MGQKSLILAIGLIIFTILLAILFVVSRLRADTPSQKIKEEIAEASSRNLVSVADIVNEPMVYDEYSLEVDSNISSWATNRSFFFTVSVGGGFGGSSRSLLAIAPQPFRLPQDPNDGKVGLGEKAKVTAKGTVEVMNKDQLEASLGIDFDDPNNALYSDTLKKWNLGPVLMINELTVNSAR